MIKVNVKFVRYDMTKTRNRKRKDMLVDGKNENAVRAQLEKIHKGEQVVQISELIWDDEQIAEVVRHDELDASKFHFGTVKFYENEKGFGFIQPDDEMEDLFFHRSACKNGLPTDRDRVEFKVSRGPKGLSATHVKVIQE